ncbi:MAG TPA: gamma-glutamyltransferase, partial [Anaerolineae bacterium]|nr:gamma-glutamyltransferase [Anaerolineae bacterium]
MKHFKDISRKRSVRILALWAVIALFLVVGLVATPPKTLDSEGKVLLGVPGVRGGVVTTSEPAAAQVGADILRAGGNAFDAAAAVQFALNVMEPQSSGIGGGGFMMIHLAKHDDTFVIDCRETAPAAATPDMFASQPSFGVRSTSGYAVGVPGTLLCATTALDNWGTYELDEVLEPAINLAENGIRVSSRLEGSILSSRLANEVGNPAYDEARNVFRPGGVPLVEGDL